MTTCYIITVTREGFNEMYEFMTMAHNELIMAKCIDLTYSKYVIIVNNERKPQNDIFKFHPETNILILNDYNEYDSRDKMCLKLIVDTPEIILEIIIKEEYYSSLYDICNDEWYAELQNISNIIYHQCVDIISVKENKLLFYCDSHCDRQPYNKDLVVIDTWNNYIDEYVDQSERVGISYEYSINLLHSEPKYISNDIIKYNGISMKRYFANINFKIIEYATIKISLIIKENFYYSLSWICKMTYLKHLNLIFDKEEEFENLEEFINELNITVVLEKLVIRTKNAINLDKLRIPFGCKVEVFI
jgi:hypothetical protein